MSDLRCMLWIGHACRHCGSRIAAADEGTPTALYECGTCAIQAGRHEDICGCGIPVGPMPRSAHDAKRARKGPRFHCVANPARSPTNPAVIVIEFGEPS